MSSGQDNRGQRIKGNAETAIGLLLRELLVLRRQLTSVTQRLSVALRSELVGLPCNSCSHGVCNERCDRLEAHLDGASGDKLGGELDSDGIVVREDGPPHIDSHRQLKPGSTPAPQSDLYMVNENGHRRIVTAEETERIRRKWSGHFLLDLPRQTLEIRTGKVVKPVKLGSGRLHWGVAKVFMVGMSQPGTSFGYAKFSKVSLGGSGIGDVSALSRYVYDARQAIGDTGRRTRYIHKTRVELAESPTRWGYVFDDRYRYLVIARCLPAECGQTAKSIEQSRVDQESGQ